MLFRSQRRGEQGLLAACLLRMGDTEGARKILEDRSLMVAARWVLGRVLAVIEERIGIEPPEPPAELGPTRWGGVRQGLLYLRAGKWEKAHGAFRAASPEDPRAPYGLGVSLYYLGHFEEARQRLVEALDRLDEPLRSDAQATLGRALLEIGETREALLLLRRAIAAGAASEENYYALGLAFLRLGRSTLARRAFEKCATLEFVCQRLSQSEPPEGRLSRGSGVSMA